MAKLIKRNFQSETLVVDWLSFKFQYLENTKQKKIVNYLFKLGFNSYQETARSAKPIKEPIRVSPTNRFEVIFVGDNPYWNGTLLHFSGLNAKLFYNLAHQKLIDWSIFSSAILSRFDLYYSRNTKTTDKISGKDFLDNCYQKLIHTTRNVTNEKNSKGTILKVGNRRSTNYSRIYTDINSLKFEYEIKGKFLQDYHKLLVSNRIQEFEDNLANLFLTYFGKLLPLNYPQLDWLVIKLRPIRKQRIPISTELALNSHYIDHNNSSDHKNFIHFLQFLNYARNLDFNRDTLGSIQYRSNQSYTKYYLIFSEY